MLRRIQKKRSHLLFGLSNECDSSKINETPIIRRLKAFALIVRYILFMKFIVDVYSHENNKKMYFKWQ